MLFVEKHSAAELILFFDGAVQEFAIARDVDAEFFDKGLRPMAIGIRSGEFP